MAKYELIEIEATHDGEGWSSNDEWRTGVIYEIDDTESDAEIIHRLCPEEKEFPSSRFLLDGSTITRTWCNPSAETEIYVANDYTDFEICIETVSEEEPLCRLELVE